MRSAIDRHLGLVLAELEAHQVGGRFPTVAAATTDLNDADVEKNVHVTSLFGSKDLWYNPSRPAVGSDRDVVAARVGKRVFIIRGNREVREVTDGFLQQAGLVTLAQTEDRPGGEQDGPANRSQPVRPETNRTSAAAGSGR